MAVSLAGAELGEKRGWTGTDEPLRIDKLISLHFNIILALYSN